MDKPNPFIWSAIGVLLLLIGFQALVSRLLSPGPENLAYSDFKHLLAAGKLSDLTVSSSTIEGTVDTSNLDRLLSPQALEAVKSPLPAGSYRFITTRAASQRVLAAA